MISKDRASHVSIGPYSDSGILFRCSLPTPDHKVPLGYMVHIGSQPYYKTGSLLVANPPASKLAMLSKVFDADAVPINYPPAPPAKAGPGQVVSYTISPPRDIADTGPFKRNRRALPVAGTGVH